METTERIVEAYVRYVKGWATIPNIRCEGQYEIDLLAIDPVSLDRYHIESGISVSQSYRKLTAKPFSKSELKKRVQKSGQRRTLGYFIEQKFGNPSVVKTLRRYGFRKGKYQRVIVSWGWTDDAEREAKKKRITLWDFREIMKEIADEFRGTRHYFNDDTLRTLHLFTHATGKSKGRQISQSDILAPKDRSKTVSRASGKGYWVYENTIRNKAIVHMASCSYCKDGQGIHRQTENNIDQWQGPFSKLTKAKAFAVKTDRKDVRCCKFCLPQETTWRNG